MELQGKRILVTGSSGFVGRYLVEALMRERAEVVTLTDRDGCEVDIRDWQKVRGIEGKTRNADMVYHLAAVASVPYSVENPRGTYETNVLGTLNMLELCRLCHIKKIIFPSSYVYGHPQYLPIDEKHPVNPTNTYARSKVLGEELCRAYHEDCGLKCVVLRIFNIYGEGQREEFLIPSILRQLADGAILLRDAEPKRDFLHVKDAVRAFIKAGEYTASDFEIFNIGAGESYSVETIARKALKIAGEKGEIHYLGERRQGEIMDVIADITKAKRELGWEPEVGMNEGLTELIRTKLSGD